MLMLNLSIMPLGDDHIEEYCEDIIREYLTKNYEGKIQLILTSPPFPLKRAKKYGNKMAVKKD